MIPIGFWILVFLTVLEMTGKVNSEDVELSCEISSLCLNQSITYTCTVQSIVLVWTIRDSNGSYVTARSLTNDNMDVYIIEKTGFVVVVTSSSTSPVTSNISISAIPVYDGYTLFCSSPDTDSRNCSLSISDIPSEPLNLMVSYEVSPTYLLWNSPSTSSACVINYTITTNASALMSTTGTSVMITKPAGDLENSTYSVSVAAVDTGGRTGPPASIDCFMFGGPRPVTVETNPVYMYLSVGICVSNTISALITWKPFDCLPETISYNVTHNITGHLSEVTVTENNFTLKNLSLGGVYQVDIVAINSLGSSLPTSTLISVPSNCPTTKPLTSMSPRPMSPSSMIPSPIDISDRSLPLVIGLLTGTAILAMGLIIVIIVGLSLKHIQGSSRASKTRVSVPDRALLTVGHQHISLTHKTASGPFPVLNHLTTDNTYIGNVTKPAVSSATAAPNIIGTYVLLGPEGLDYEQSNPPSAQPIKSISPPESCTPTKKSNQNNVSCQCQNQPDKHTNGISIQESSVDPSQVIEAEGNMSPDLGVAEPKQMPEKPDSHPKEEQASKWSENVKNNDHKK